MFLFPSPPLSWKLVGRSGIKKRMERRNQLRKSGSKRKLSCQVRPLAFKIDRNAFVPIALEPTPVYINRKKPEKQTNNIAFLLARELFKLNVRLQKSFKYSWNKRESIFIYLFIYLFIFFISFAFRKLTTCQPATAFAFPVRPGYRHDLGGRQNLARLYLCSG